MKKASHPTSRSGRFAGGPAADVTQFSESVSFDWRLWECDLIGSLAHAAMLAKVGVLTPAEAKAIGAGLEQIGQEIADGRFQWKLGLEDVTRNVGKAFIREVSRQLEQDIPIWEHKVYFDRPVLCDGDGPIGLFRKWCRQFYSKIGRASCRERV